MTNSVGCPWGSALPPDGWRERAGRDRIKASSTTRRSPSAQTTTTTLAPSTSHNGLGDCLSCALDVLSQNGFVRSRLGWRTLSGAPLVLQMAVGPSDLDQTVATAIAGEWAAIGITVHLVDVRSEVAAAVATATNADDLSIFTRPTITAVSYTARAWSGPGYADATSLEPVRDCVCADGFH